MFKMGGAHTVRGIGPNGVKTLGDHVADIASQAGKTSLHVSIYPFYPESAVPLPESFRNAEYVLVDCAKLTTLLATDAELSANQDLQDRLSKTDYVILIPTSSKASKTTIRGIQKTFVRSKLVSFGLGLLPILLVLPTIGYAFWCGLSKLRGRESLAGWSMWMPCGVAVFWLALVAYQLWLMLKAPADATPSSMGVSWGVDLLKIVSIIALGWIGFRRQDTGRLYWLGAIGCVGLIAFVHFWGLGSLLGI